MMHTDQAADRWWREATAEITALRDRLARAEKVVQAARDVKEAWDAGHLDLGLELGGLPLSKQEVDATEVIMAELDRALAEYGEDTHRSRP